MDGLWWNFLLKWMILGHPHFRKPPYMCIRNILWKYMDIYGHIWAHRETYGNIRKSISLQSDMNLGAWKIATFFGICRIKRRWIFGLSLCQETSKHGASTNLSNKWWDLRWLNQSWDLLSGYTANPSSQSNIQAFDGTFIIFMDIHRGSSPGDVNIEVRLSTPKAKNDQQMQGNARPGIFGSPPGLKNRGIFCETKVAGHQEVWWTAAASRETFSTCEAWRHGVSAASYSHQVVGEISWSKGFPLEFFWWLKQAIKHPGNGMVYPTSMAFATCLIDLGPASGNAEYLRLAPIRYGVGSHMNPRFPSLFLMLCSINGNMHSLA